MAKKPFVGKILFDTPHAVAAAECGGTLIYARLAAPLGKNGGCGTLTHVVGTNEGKMPCGSLLTMFGKKEPYYCAICQSTMEKSQNIENARIEKETRLAEKIQKERPDITWTEALRLARVLLDPIPVL